MINKDFLRHLMTLKGKRESIRAFLLPRSKTHCLLPAKRISARQ